MINPSKLKKYGKPLKLFKPNYTVKVSKRVQPNYSYTLTEPIGKNFDPDFKPEITPKQLLELGVFEGKYFNLSYTEFPREWFSKALRMGKIGLKYPDPSVNFFKVKSRMSLKEWKKRGWLYGKHNLFVISSGKGKKYYINKPRKNYKNIRKRSFFIDPYGHCQWYFRYYLGRRIPEVDKIQIKRWKSIRRHIGQIKKNCKKKNISCRPKQRQTILQWYYNPFII